MQQLAQTSLLLALEVESEEEYLDDDNDESATQNVPVRILSCLFSIVIYPD
jgi:hypothetical protein